MFHRFYNDEQIAELDHNHKNNKLKERRKWIYDERRNNSGSFISNAINWEK